MQVHAKAKYPMLINGMKVLAIYKFSRKLLVPVGSSK